VPNAPSVAYDAVFIPGGDSVAELMTLPPVVAFVSEMYAMENRLPQLKMPPICLSQATFRQATALRRGSCDRNDRTIETR